MVRGWSLALAAACVMNAGLAVQAESKWHLPRPSLFAGKSKTESRPPKKKNPVQPASAWFPFEVKPTEHAKTLVQAPVKFAKFVGNETMDLMGRTRDTLAMPFRHNDLPPAKKAPRKSAKRAAKKKSIFSNPFARSEPEPEEVRTLTDFLRQPRPGFE